MSKLLSTRVAESAIATNKRRDREKEEKEELCVCVCVFCSVRLNNPNYFYTFGDISFLPWLATCINSGRRQRQEHADLKM